MFCAKCGRSLEESDGFCPRCGNKVGEAPVTEHFRGGSGSRPCHSPSRRPVMVMVSSILSYVVSGVLMTILMASFSMADDPDDFAGCVLGVPLVFMPAAAGLLMHFRRGWGRILNCVALALVTLGMIICVADEPDNNDNELALYLFLLLPLMVVPIVLQYLSISNRWFSRR